MLPIQLALKGGRAQKAGDASMGCAAAVMQYLVAGAFLAVAIDPSISNAQPTTGGRLMAGGMAVLVYVFGRWGRRRVARAARFDARLVVMPDRLVVRHDGLLAAPVVVPRELVEAVAVGRRSTLFLPLPRTSLPMLDPMPRAPNLVLRFREPVDFPARRRFWPRTLRTPASGETGLLLRIRDPAAAERAFAPWGVLRPSGSVDELVQAPALRRRDPLFPT